MRLYSRYQLVGYILIAVAVTMIGSFVLGSRVAEREEAIIAEISPHADPEATISLRENIPTVTLAADEAVSYTQDERQNITVYEKANEAVVNITTEVVGINWFLEPVPQEGGSGSGSIIDTRGFVLTNSHVISNAVKIYISLSDGSQYEGEVVGVDQENDIAVLKFTPPKNSMLTTIQFGSSEGLKVGQKVLAIGNPFGLERTLTTGIVSALGRPIKTSSNTVIRDMIQTDTAINPGNSGGPLLDTAGRMIGINTMIYSTSGSSAGVGFAIPVNTAKRVVSEIIQFGKVRRGTIDADLVQLNSAIANYADLSVHRGLLVSRVGPGS
ncbi:MAG TPA: trypsin-like peptidase domain-containing protein, partial [Treponemataceae bacterium]|nr:trypsin-like peptidase domain-containing protein [Treponemataceae bacterium]